MDTPTAENQARDLVTLTTPGPTLTTLGPPQESLARQVATVPTLQLHLERKCHLTRDMQIAERLDGCYFLWQLSLEQCCFFKSPPKMLWFSSQELQESV